MPRHRALVTQHLENVSRDVLGRYQDIVRAHIRRRQGIYALYRRGKLYYVGLASDLRGRLTSHLRDKHGDSWDRFSVYLTIGDEHMRELEALMLRIIKPGGNKVKGKFAKSENLRPKIAHDVRRLRREEEERMWGTRTGSAGELKATAPRPGNAGQGHGRRPVLARYTSKPFPLVARYKRKLYRARVRKNGSISFRGNIYNSPSLAATAVVKRNCNGWAFWTYERSPGYWVKLEKLRQR
jgi:predicted GIY-YIG superfamily endonuclease